MWPLLPIGVSVFCLSALTYYNWNYGIEARSVLQVLIAGIYSTVGFAPAWMFFLLLLTWSSIWFYRFRQRSRHAKTLRSNAGSPTFEPRFTPNELHSRTRRVWVGEGTSL
jgi:hypothetical protein